MPPRLPRCTNADHNGKVGLIGSYSGGRHAFIYACQRKDIDACVEQWGGHVVMGKEELNAKTPVAPIDMTKDLSCPLLGLLGNEDRAPSPEQVNQHEAELKKHGKSYQFHRYDGAGHGFFYLAPAALSPRAGHGWLGQDMGRLRQASGEVGGSGMCTRAPCAAGRRHNARLHQHGPRGRCAGGYRVDAGDCQGAARRSRPGDYRRRVRGGGSAGQGCRLPLEAPGRRPSAVSTSGINAPPWEPMPGIVKAIDLAAHYQLRGVPRIPLSWKSARAPSCGRHDRPKHIACPASLSSMVLGIALPAGDSELRDDREQHVREFIAARPRVCRSYAGKP
jgi:hypothetical protein